MKYDVVVVGGRIGGSVSSLFASKNDLDVLMIEKRQEIGTPVQCAGATTCDAFKILNMKPLPQYVATEIHGGTICSPDGNRATLKGKKIEGFVLERKIFDKYLAIESARAGTDIMLKTNVTGLIRNNGKVCGVVAKHLGKTTKIKADIVIAADGIESQIAQMAGLDTKLTTQDLGSCAQYEVVGADLDPNYIEFYFGENIAPGGYLWVFPKGEGRANIGVGVRNSPQNAYHYLQKFTAPLDVTPIELNVGGVPLSGPVQKTYADGIIVVGDAAGQVDPLSGGGIHPTVECGKIAGEIAAEAVLKEDTSAGFLKNYEKIWRKKVGKNLEKSLKYRRIMDKLKDEDFNAISKFLEGHDLESISKLSMIGLIKGHPNLLRLLKDIL
ncbi:MAG TPA: NAD(P)/FAD-dependent oxidoreductase [Methanobacteriaceae archaeon]|nr:NAD(P)/FAD-dependent oxidoreductase [Methanobacteriaceae archaeon]